jgi:hypothetical protein
MAQRVQMPSTVADLIPGAPDWRLTVVAATVRLPRTGGQGVLVPGGYILTAAHCVEWHTGGMMTLDDSYEPVETRTHGCFRMCVEAVEPVADIAVLGVADGQRLDKDADAFEEFQAATRPLVVKDLKAPPPPRFKLWTMADLRKPGHFRRPKPPKQSVERVYVLTHEGQWIEGTASLNAHGASGARTWLRAKQKIDGGTSGGPIVDEHGRLLGVVSHSSEEAYDDDGFTGAFPSPPRALPSWLWRRIRTAAKEPPSSAS